MGSRRFRNGMRRTLPVSSRVGSKLPLQFYADVRLHIPMTHRNYGDRYVIIVCMYSHEH